MLPGGLQHTHSRHFKIIASFDEQGIDSTTWHIVFKTVLIKSPIIRQTKLDSTRNAIEQVLLDTRLKSRLNHKTAKSHVKLNVELTWSCLIWILKAAWSSSLNSKAMLFCWIQQSSSCTKPSWKSIHVLPTSLWLQSPSKRWILSLLRVLWSKITKLFTIFFFTTNYYIHLSETIIKSEKTTAIKWFKSSIFVNEHHMLSSLAFT